MIDYQAAFVHAPVAMCIANARDIVVCNVLMEAVFGCPAGALNGRSFHDLYPSTAEYERTGNRVVPSLAQQGRYADQRIMRRCDGELFWCRTSGAMLHGPGEPALSIWTFDDISAQRPVSLPLTPRQREVAALLVLGQSSKMIGFQLGLSARTVDDHRAALMKKFAASTYLELTTMLTGHGSLGTAGGH